MPPSIHKNRRMGLSLFLIHAGHKHNNVGIGKLSGAGEALCRGFAPHENDVGAGATLL
jgi:hypothetical protein